MTGEPLTGLLPVQRYGRKLREQQIALMTVCDLYSPKMCVNEVMLLIIIKKKCFLLFLKMVRETSITENSG